MVQKNDISSGANWKTAKSLCENSTIGGYADWRLLSLGKLEMLYSKKNEIGGFSNSYYWSSKTGYSTDVNYRAYWTVDFSTGATSEYSIENETYRVRVVRTLL